MSHIAICISYTKIVIWQPSHLLYTNVVQQKRRGQVEALQRENDFLPSETNQFGYPHQEAIKKRAGRNRQCLAYGFVFTSASHDNQGCDWAGASDFVGGALMQVLAHIIIQYRDLDLVGPIFIS